MFEFLLSTFAQVDRIDRLNSFGRFQKEFSAARLVMVLEIYETIFITALLIGEAL